MFWLQRTSPASMTDEDLREHLRRSYDLVVSRMPKRDRATLKKSRQ
jgi:predicted DNA-binding protein (MmcQ/YjbR family)